MNNITAETITKERTTNFPNIVLLESETPYLEGQILSDVGEECVLFEPQRNSDKRRIDLVRLEYSSELL
ncbi:MAG TPA: hypothetical protein VES68_04140 [Candidatus Sulfotelmatobacter sp.]|nr:hypothetical protein [Candidatus Sulfotelmatobacter sp.]